MGTMDVVDPPGVNLNLAQMSPAAQQVIGAMATLAQMGSIPLREPVYNRPTFWSYPLNEMRARIVPPTTAFVDFIVIQMGRGRAPVGYSAKFQYWVMTGLNDPATSGITFRFLVNGSPFDPATFGITSNIDQCVERVNAPNPWPAQPQRFNMLITNDRQIRLQVRNTSGINQRAFAALYGYYYPNLGDLTRGSLERGVLNEDAATDIGQGTDKP